MTLQSNSLYIGIYGHYIRTRLNRTCSRWPWNYILSSTSILRTLRKMTIIHYLLLSKMRCVLALDCLLTLMRSQQVLLYIGIRAHYDIVPKNLTGSRLPSLAILLWDPMTHEPIRDAITGFSCNEVIRLSKEIQTSIDTEDLLWITLSAVISWDVKWSHRTFWSQCYISVPMTIDITNAIMTRT